MTIKNGKLFVLSAPSGGGKTTIAHTLIQEIGADYNLSRVITYTSRKPRSTDIPGIDYHFITSSQFEEKAQKGFFLEWSGAYGHYYGTPSTIIEDLTLGKSYIAVVDRTGVRSILSCYEQAVTFWVEPPSMDILEERLRARKTESEEDIQRRLMIARQELQEEAVVDFYTHRFCNDIFERVKDEIKAIIIGELRKK